MLGFLLLSLLCGSTLGGFIPTDPRFFKNINSETRIVGGVESDIKDAPFQTGFLYFQNSYYYLYCSGSILKPNVILSTSACIDNTIITNWVVRAGSSQWASGGQAVNISRVIMHESYKTNPSSRWDYDISLVITSTPFNLNGVTIATINLPAQHQALADATIGVITGWGSPQQGGSPVATIHKAYLPVVNQKKCVGADLSEKYKITERMICVGDYEHGGVAPCNSDSGSPFVVNSELIGIYSWSNGCGKPRSPSLYTRVASFRKWVDENSP